MINKCDDECIIYLLYLLFLSIILFSDKIQKNMKSLKRKV